MAASITVVEQTDESRLSPSGSFCLSTLVGDETYITLKRTFLPKGKGRPPDPPSVCLTNKLLLQLELIKQDGNKSRKDVAAWFCRLFPEVNYPASRLLGVLDRLLQKSERIHSAGGDVKGFLQNEVDFDFVSASLMKLGLKRGDLMDMLQGSTNRTTTEPLFNEVIVDLENFRSREGMSATSTAKWIKALTGTDETDQKLLSSVKKLMQAYRTLNKQKGGVHDEKLSVFLAMPFVVYTVHKTQKSQQSSTPADDVKKAFVKLQQDNSQLQIKVQALEYQNTILKDTIRELSQEKLQLLDKTKESCTQACDLQQALHTIKVQKQIIRELQPASFHKLRKQVQHLRGQERVNRQLRRQLAKTREDATRQKESLLRNSRKLKAKILKQQQESEDLHHHISVLSEECSTSTAQPLQTRVKHEGNRFSNEIRTTVMRLQGEANVPARMCSRVISIISDCLFKRKFADKELPTHQTNINILSEGQVLSSIQTTEKLLQVQNATLHTDGTSRDTKKYVGQQVTLDSGETISLGFQIVATEDASTLLDVTVSQLDQLSELYSEYSDTDRDIIFKQVLSKLTSLMSDRAAVMKRFNADLHAFAQTELGQDTLMHFLHCNAHFLLGLSRSCEMQLKVLEQEVVSQLEPQQKLGRDKSEKFLMFAKSAEVATSRLIRTASDLTGPRGDEKNGCRQDWLAFCDEDDKESKMTSYRANRFNSYFAGAAAIIHHRHDLSAFFSSLEHSNLKMESVVADLEDERLMILVCAIAIIYLRVSAPYWRLLQSKVKYTELHKYIQLLKQRFERWSEDADTLVDPAFVGIFDGEFELPEEPIQDSVFEFALQHAEPVKLALQRLMPGMLEVTTRQLGDFMQGAKFGGPPVPTPEGLDHCPVHNLLGENVFGDLDFDISKRRNATAHTRSSIHMLGHNKTGKWLHGKREAESNSLLTYARKKGRFLRQHHREEERLVLLRLRRKLAENRQRQLEKEAKQAAAKTDLIRRLATVGGPCETAADVDRLTISLRNESESVLQNALKDQVRYQKIILKRKGSLRLGGTTEDLVEGLKTHLGHEEPNDDDSDTGDVNELHPDTELFVFQRQGQWVAVFFDNTYYIGQVTHVLSTEKAIVKYLERVNNTSVFKWPRLDDEAETEAVFVFQWDVDVNPVSNDMRQWKVSGLPMIEHKYLSLRG